MALESVKEDLKLLEKTSARGKGDTIRLWESYRDQAHFWRAFSLIQLPLSALCVALALVIYSTADTIVEVPAKPQPGNYSVKELPDSEFVAVAQEVVNLISTYQYTNAAEQFASVRKYLWEPALSIFEQRMMLEELKAITDTKRLQIFMVDKNQIKVQRFPEEQKIVVHLPGTRYKLINTREVPAERLLYHLTMMTIPRNASNEYGIVIVDLGLRKDESPQ